MSPSSDRSTERSRDSVHLVDVVCWNSAIPLVVCCCFVASRKRQATTMVRRCMYLQDFTQRLLRSAQLAFNSRNHTIGHLLVSVTCHCQILVDELMARPLTAALFSATFSAGNNTSNGCSCPIAINCLLSTLHFQVCCRSNKSLCW